MITADPSFEKKIVTFIKHNPENLATERLEKLKPLFPHLKSYHCLLDFVLAEWNITFGVMPVYVDGREKEVGYVPIINFGENNKLNKPSVKMKLIDDIPPIKYALAQADVAKKVLSILSSVDSIEDIVLKSKS